jgi:probable phosphoglycerate mutase
VVPGLREVHTGELEGGRFRIAVADRDPVILRLFAEERWDVIPGAENMEAFEARVGRPPRRWWLRAGRARRSSSRMAARSPSCAARRRPAARSRS